VSRQHPKTILHPANEDALHAAFTGLPMLSPALLVRPRSLAAAWYHSDCFCCRSKMQSIVTPSR
jgi:hypothetical protein